MSDFFRLSSTSIILAFISVTILSAVGSGVNATAGVYFVRSPQPIVAPPGDRVVFECETNVPPERVVWLHGQKPLERTDAVSNTSTSITGKKIGKEAEELSMLKGREQHTHGDGVTKSTHLTVRISRNPHRYRQQAGEYQCVTWFGAVALTSLPAKLSIASLGDFPDLNLSSFILNENRSSEFVSGPYSLQHSGPSRPQLSTKSRDNNVSNNPSIHSIEVFPGETAVIPCPPPPSDPPATIKFYKDGFPLMESDRIRLFPSGNLHIINITQVDSGQYTCAASNHITGEVLECQRLLKLVVKSIPSKSNSLSLLWKPEERYIAQIGQNVTLECASSGWPRPSVRWSRDGNRTIPASRSHPIGSGALLISDLQDEDEGTYVCEISDMLGHVSNFSTLLQLTEPVSMLKSPEDSRVEEGSKVVLNCLAKGRPPPQQYWVFNGQLLYNDSHIAILDNQLIISNVSRRHAGIFQCFVSNSLTKVDGSTATLEVVPQSQIATDDVDDRGEENDHNDDQYRFDSSATTTSSTRPFDSKMRHILNGKTKKGKFRGKEMVPPSKPNITRLSDESVMVRWSVPPNEGLPIEFFKVQYKEAEKKGSRWKTIDEDIPSHIRSYEVTGLKAAQTYRFRIAAVYSNNDNKLGPNSGKFVLEKEPRKKPAFSPIIESIKPVSPSAIMIHWKYPDSEAVPLEGFFIYYRSTASAGDYTKATVLGSNTRSHIITHLLPETHYDLKMQAFNMQGTSEFSRILTARTLGSTPYHSSTFRSHNSFSSNHRDLSNTLENIDVVSSDSSVSNDTLYVVLGSVLGGLTVLVVLLVALYQCRQRNSQRGSAHPVWSNMNDNDSKSNNEISSSLSSQNRTYSSKTHNGHSTPYNTRHDPIFPDQRQSNDNTAETSFSDSTQLAPVDRRKENENMSLTRNYPKSPSVAIVLPLAKRVESNTLPLLRHSVGREPCLDDSDWEASVPPGDSEKFI